MKRLAVLDGSLHGRMGNTGQVIGQLLPLLHECEIDYIELNIVTDISALHDRLRQAHGFIIGSGTYWQSWGSPLQRFLEQATPWEGTDVFMGKPLCTIITMHSIGGMEVMGRLQSNFALLGCMVPPMCSLVHSHVNQMIDPLQANHDVWDLRYLPTVAHNLREALNGTHHYEAWDVDQGEEVTGIWFNKKSRSVAIPLANTSGHFQFNVTKKK